MLVAFQLISFGIKYQLRKVLACKFHYVKVNIISLSPVKPEFSPVSGNGCTVNETPRFDRLLWFCFRPLLALILAHFNFTRDCLDPKWSIAAISGLEPLSNLDRVQNRKDPMKRIFFSKDLFKIYTEVILRLIIRGQGKYKVCHLGDWCYFQHPDTRLP